MSHNFVVERVNTGAAPAHGGPGEAGCHISPEIVILIYQDSEIIP